MALSFEEKTSKQHVLNALESAGFVRSVNVNKVELQAYFHSGDALFGSPGSADSELTYDPVIKEDSPTYVVEPESGQSHNTKNEQALTQAAKHYKLYLNMSLPSHYEHIIAQWNHQELAKMTFSSHPTEWLHHFTPFLSRSETEIALMLRFVKQRNEFFEQNTMLSADAVLEVLGLAKKNARRTVRDLSNKQQLILFKYENKLLAPACQFNRKGQVYPALLKILPTVHQLGVDLLELAMWLTSSFPVLIAAEKSSDNLSDVPFDDMLKQAETAQQNSVYINKRPIDCLANGELSLFELLVKRWIKSDQFSLNNTAIHSKSVW